MSTLDDRPRTALLVIDVQNSVVGEAHDRDRVVANVATLVDKARTAGVDVVWVAHSSPHMEVDTEGWHYVPELTPGEAEPMVHKRFPDSFEDTDLEQVLAERGVGSLVLAGAQTDECIRSTLHGAIARGYDARLVSDAHTTEDQSPWGAPTPDLVIAHTNLYWENHQAPGRTAGTVTTEAIDFADATG